MTNHNPKNRIRHVTVFLYQENSTPVTINFAARYAACFGAVLKGVYVKPWRELPQAYYRRLPESQKTWIDNEISARAVLARQQLQERCVQYGVEMQWFETTGDAASIGSDVLHGTDVGIIGQNTGADTAFERHVTNEVLLGSGRPVVVVPRGVHEVPIGKNVIVAWDASPAATRALHEALPILARSDTEVGIAEIFGSKAPDAARENLARHLRRHGVEPQFRRIPAALRSAGVALIEDSVEHGADLIVMGVWGHSRAHEFLFGGVSRTLLNQSPIPIFTCN